MKQPQKTIIYHTALILCILYAGLSIFLLITHLIALSNARFLDNYLNDVIDVNTGVYIPDITGENSSNIELQEHFQYVEYYKNLAIDITGLIVSVLASIALFIAIKSEESKNKDG